MFVIETISLMSKYVAACLETMIRRDGSTCPRPSIQFCVHDQDLAYAVMFETPEEWAAFKAQVAALDWPEEAGEKLCSEEGVA